jgi:hypothetical protein
MHKKTVTRIFINDSMPDAHLGRMSWDCLGTTEIVTRNLFLRLLVFFVEINFSYPIGSVVKYVMRIVV